LGKRSKMQMAGTVERLKVKMSGRREYKERGIRKSRPVGRREGRADGK
jgi:hypothetical protein